MSATAASAGTVLAVAKVLNPIVSDLYRSAKGAIQKELKKWEMASASRSISKTLLKLESVRTLWSPDKDVALRKFYYPSKLSQKGVAIRGGNPIESFDQLPSGNLVIQGIVGQGKSMFMRYLALDLIERSGSGIPLFIEFRSLTAKVGIKDAIKKRMEALDVKLSDDGFDYLAESGKFVLILDAFDELSESLVAETISELDFYQIRYPALRIIVSSRPGNEIQKVSGFEVYNLSPLSRVDYRPFLDALGTVSFKKSDLIHAITESSANISGLIRTPLMMTLVVLVYEAEREIPPTLPDFFERLFQVVFSRHDRLKAGFIRKHHSGLSERKLQTLFEAFCFMSMQNGFGRSLTDEQFAEAFSNALEYCPDCKCELEKFRQDLTKVSCLMLEDGLGQVTFLHKSIAEYYAAAFIKHSPDNVAVMFYEAVIEQYKQWWDVVYFLEDVDPYRFAKYFCLKEIAAAIEKFDNLLNTRNDEDLINFIRKDYSEFSVGYHKDKSDKAERPISDVFSFSSLGPFDAPGSHSMRQFSDCLCNAMESTVPQVLTNEGLQQIAVASVGKKFDADIDARGEVEIPFDVIIRYFGSDDLWVGISGYQIMLKRNYEIAENIVLEQEKRKMIFKKVGAGKSAGP